MHLVVFNACRRLCISAFGAFSALWIIQFTKTAPAPKTMLAVITLVQPFPCFAIIRTAAAAFRAFWPQKQKNISPKEAVAVPAQVPISLAGDA